jgi:hypothetical protein
VALVLFVRARLGATTGGEQQQRARGNTLDQLLIRRGRAQATEHAAQAVYGRERHERRRVRLARLHVVRRSALHALEHHRAPLWLAGDGVDGDLAAERDPDDADPAGADVGALTQVLERSVGVLLEPRGKARRAAVALAVAVEVEDQDAVPVPGQQPRMRGDAESVAPCRAQPPRRPRCARARTSHAAQAARRRQRHGLLGRAEVGVVDGAPGGKMGEVDGEHHRLDDEEGECRGGDDGQRSAERPRLRATAQP